MTCAEKIKNELGSVRGVKENVVKDAVADALIMFCEQNEEFARAVMQTSKTFAECCEYVVKDSKKSLSDNEAYRRAVEFYFPGAKVDVVMTIRMSEYDEPSAKSAHGDISISLLELL